VTWSTLLIAPALMLGVVLAFRFPIYLRHGTKLCVFTIPLFMLVALTPPPVAGAGAAVAILVGELLVRKARGTLPGDIAASTVRWGFLALVASVTAGLPLALPALSLGVAAVFLGVGDLLTIPFIVAPIVGEPFGRVLRTVAREAGPAEAAQYAVGILGVILARELPEAIVLFVVPAILMYIVFQKPVDPETMELLEQTADGLELRDPYLQGHARRVTEYVRTILDGLHMHGQEAEQILIAARLHNVGRIRLPDELILKSEDLTPADQAGIHSYPELGAQLLAVYPDLSRVLEMVRHHQEAWDGSGYPAGLRGAEIPFGARVIAVANAFEAMTHDRPHRRALSVERAAEFLRDGRGRQWDPAVVDVFLTALGGETPGIGTLPSGSAAEDRLLESGLPAVGEAIA
jgi:HD-GYP domain-containing protein (c-di-GMP phosphodiesterase class II)